MSANSDSAAARALQHYTSMARAEDEDARLAWLVSAVDMLHIHVILYPTESHANYFLKHSYSETKSTRTTTRTRRKRDLPCSVEVPWEPYVRRSTISTLTKQLLKAKK